MLIVFLILIFFMSKIDTVFSISIYPYIVYKKMMHTTKNIVYIILYSIVIVIIITH